MQYIVRNLFLSFFLMLSIFPNTKAQEIISIKGHLSEVPTGTLIFLTYSQEHQNRRDSCVVKDGIFTLKKKLSKPTFGYVFQGYYPGSSYKSTSDYRLVYLEKGEIKLVGDNSLKYAQLSGTYNNKALEIYASRVKPIELKKDLAQAEFYKKEPKRSKKEEENALRIYNMTMGALKDEELAVKRSYALDYPNTALTLFMIRDISKGTPDVTFLESIYAKMDYLSRNSAEGKSFKEELDARVRLAIGKRAPDFIQNDSTGRPIQFSQFGKGKYVLVDFWASWCAPCRAENPNVVAAYEKYKISNFDIIGIALETNLAARSKWINAIAQDKLTWMQVTDFKFWNNEVALEYNVQSVPTNYLVDPNGVIIAKNLRGEALHEKLAELFGY